MPKKGGTANHGQGKIAKTVYATSVTESRMLDLIKNGSVARDRYAAGLAAGTAGVVQSRLFTVACGVQRWHLVAHYHAVVWVDSARDGVTLYTQEADAIGYYLQVAADLESKHAAPPRKRRSPTWKDKP